MIGRSGRADHDGRHISRLKVHAVSAVQVGEPDDGQDRGQQYGAFAAQQLALDLPEDDEPDDADDCQDFQRGHVQLPSRYLRRRSCRHRGTLGFGPVPARPRTERGAV
jgi:hypothetical protein